MTVVHFLEENTVLLCQLLNQVPAENDAVKIKGRKGTVLSVKNLDDLVQVNVILEKKLKNQPAGNDKKKKR
ncbi:hypothetical protein [Metabacillus schmidteae]|uniref:hypothetical protein n=1 Tax=Metabacillus schmidteae TaxID=2730405 RepID=UPI00158BD465|nr:hypothetical protein [Metabacillus schmidteae]